MPTSSFRSPPLIRVPIAVATPRGYVRCPECFRKWPNPDPYEQESGSESDSSPGSGTPVTRHSSPSLRPRSRPGSLPSIRSTQYPPKHDCLGHTEDLQTERTWETAPSDKTRSPSNGSKKSRNSNSSNRFKLPTTETAEPFPAAADVACCQESFYSDEACCSRKRSVWDKIRNVFRGRGRNHSSLRIDDDLEFEGKRRWRTRRRKQASITWSRTASVVDSD